MYDCIIIGTGPAGLSAALNLKTYKKSFVWFGSKNLSDKVQKAEKITNYPGFPELTGQELFSHFTDHIQSAGLDITEKTVTNVMSVGTYYMVLADNEVYEAKTLILAMGVMTAKLLKGEDELLGRGVSYCATCDGMFYKDKEIAVLCNDPKYEHEVEYLADLAAKVTYFPMFSDSQIKKENVTISKDFPLEIKGSDRVTGLVLKSGKVLELDGIFCLRNAIAPSKLVSGLEIENGHIAPRKQICPAVLQQETAPVVRISIQKQWEKEMWQHIAVSVISQNSFYARQKRRSNTALFRL